MKNYLVILLITIICLFFTGNISAQSSIYFTSPTNGQAITELGLGSTNETIPLNLMYYSNPVSSIYYVKLFPSPYPTEQSNVGNGITQWWYLPAGTYTWRIELWEGTITGEYFKTAEQTITFYIKHTIKVSNNFDYGTINIDGVPETGGSFAYKITGENLLVGAVDQINGGYYKVWNQSGVNNSVWKRSARNENFYKIFGATTRNYNYTVANNDNGATIKAILKKQYDITRNDQTEFDGTISAGVVSQIVEQNNGTVSAPSTKTVNSKVYNYIGWTDDYSASNPRTITPVDNTTYTALYKYPEHSNNSAAYANTSSRKATRTNDGTLWSVYESMGKAWLETSTNDGQSWQTKILNNGEDAKTPTITSFNWSVIIAYQIKFGSTGSTIKVDYYSSPNTLVNSLFIEDSFLGIGDYSSDLNPVIESKFYQQHEGDFIIAWKGGDGLYFSNGACDIYNGLYWRSTRYQKISGTTTGDEYPALAILKDGSSNTYHLAFQRSLSIRYCQLIEDYQHNFTYTAIETPSSGSGCTENTHPSIIVLGDNTPRLAWYGYSNIGGKVLLKGGITILKQAVLRSRQSSGSWYYRFWKFGSLVKLVNINRSDDGNYILAWTRAGSSDQFIKNSDYNTLHNFSTFGNGIQVVSNSLLTDMTAISYNASTLPYQFNQTSKVGTINKTTATDQYAAREGMVLKDEGEFHFIVGDILLDNEPIEFTDISPEQNITSKAELNHYLETKAFEINDNSNLEFSVLFGVTDSTKAYNVLGENDNVNFKMEMLDDATGQVIGSYDNVTFTKNNLNLYKNISYQVSTQGIGNKRVKLRLVVNNNFDAHFILGEIFSDNNVLNKTVSSEISFQGTMEVKRFNLTQNYPNPFNPSTIIRYQLPKEGFVTLKVYDILGREVATLVNQKQSIGRYEATFSTSNGASQLAAGVYIYRLTVRSGLENNFTSSKKMILLK